MQGAFAAVDLTAVLFIDGVGDGWLFALCLTANLQKSRLRKFLFKQGEIGKCMYIVHSGKVAIYSNYGEANELRLQEVEPVACFGEMGMISGEPRSTTAVVEVSDTQVEIIRPEDLADLFRTNPAKIDMILKNMSYLLRTVTYEYFKACQEIYAATGKKDD